MMMKDVLTAIGFHVVGPFGKVSDAIEVIDRERLRAAVLDVNLRGETIYSLADALTGWNVPLVFVTGYGPEAIDTRFANVPVLQKPVDSAALRPCLTGSAGQKLRRGAYRIMTRRPLLAHSFRSSPIRPDGRYRSRSGSMRLNANPRARTRPGLTRWPSSAVAPPGGRTSSLSDLADYTRRGVFWRN